jgi:F-box associated protein
MSFKPGPILFIPGILSKLPPEIRLAILEELSLPDKLTLAQTCRAFQHVMYKVPYRDDSNLRHRHRPGRSMQEFLTVDEQLEYLCQVTRNRPDSWACHVCVAAHAKIDFPDTPRQKTLQNEMDHHCQRTKRIKPRHSCTLSSASLMLLVKHHHVQLLFKYLRRWEDIDDARRQYAQDLAASFTHCLPATRGGVSEGSMMLQLKMVLTRNEETGCQEPRLLLKTVRTYEERQFFRA